MTANVDPGTSPTLPVATEVIGPDNYQLIKLIDGTPTSTTPVGTSANPFKTQTPLATAGALTAKTVTTTNLSLATANANRRGVAVINTSDTITAYIAYGFTATSANYSAAIGPGESREIPSWAVGLAINAITASGTAILNVTEGT